MKFSRCYMCVIFDDAPTPSFSAKQTLISEAPYLLAIMRAFLD